MARYTLAPELYGLLVSQRRSGAMSLHHRVHPERSRRDALGSVRNLANSAQTVTDTRDYKAFGLTNASSGSTANRFWWVGRLGYYWQPDTGDYWVRARIEEPNAGRWSNRDPVQTWDAPNLYLYVQSRGTRFADPSGLVGYELRDPYTPLGPAVPAPGRGGPSGGASGGVGVATKEECRDNRGKLKPDPVWVSEFWKVVGRGGFVTAGGGGSCFCIYRKVRRQLYRGEHIRECRTLEFRIRLCPPSAGWVEVVPWHEVEREVNPFLETELDRRRVYGKWLSTHYFFCQLRVACMCRNPGTGALEGAPTEIPG